MTNPSLKERIQEDMKSAMKAQDKQRLGTIRLLMAAIKQREVDERITLDDTQIISVIDKMLKQRRDSIDQYQQANRQDLVDQEVFEVKVIQEYLPPALSATEIDALVKQAIAESGASSVKDMGKVMNIIKPKVQGRADMGIVGAKIKELLG